jgi:hypothetical protein
MYGTSDANRHPPVHAHRVNSKKSVSPGLPFDHLIADRAVVAELLLIAWSKIVGFEVSPVAENSSSEGRDAGIMKIVGVRKLDLAIS